MSAGVVFLIETGGTEKVTQIDVRVGNEVSYLVWKHQTKRVLRGSGYLLIKCCIVVGSKLQGNIR